MQVQGRPTPYMTRAKLDKVAAPTTRFGEAEELEGGVNVTAVAWDQVALHEPANVGQWFLYLHQNECPQARELLDILYVDTDSEALELHRQWSTFEQSDLPCILMDVLSEADMFTEARGPGIFKNMAYSTKALTTLSYFLLTIWDSSRTTDQSDGHLPIAKKLPGNIRGIISRMDSFCRAMWQKRHLIPTTRRHTRLDAARARFHRFSSMVVVTILKLHRLQSGPNYVPLSNYVDLYILYSWTYAGLHDKDTWLRISVLYDLLEADAGNIPLIIDEIVKSSQDSYPRDLIEKMSRTFRDESVSTTDAFTMSCICTEAICHARKVVIGVPVSVVSLIPSLLLCCQRLMCSSPMSAPPIVGMLTRIVLFAMRFNGDQLLNAMEQFSSCAGKLNVIAILGCALLEPMDRADESHLSSAISLILCLRGFAISLGTRGGTGEVADNLRYTGIRVWHDTMKSIMSVPTKQDTTLTRMKSRAIRTWREYGEVFGWKAGVHDKSVAKQPSKPSDELRYWKIPKICYSNACACSAHPASHRMRVCKGCFRVLYCSRECQQSDWNAGHRLFCKRISD